MQDAKTGRILVVSAVLIIVCMVCIFVSIRFADRYRDKSAETALLEQRLEDLEQDIKKLVLKTMELEAMRYDLSIEKEQTSRDYSVIRDRYASLGKTIKALEMDVNGLKEILKNIEEYDADAETAEEGSDEIESRLRVLQGQNKELLREIAEKTREKMILRIALESQAKRLGLTEGYDPELKNIIKNLVTSLQ